jgi:hypothetical protein
VSTKEDSHVKRKRKESERIGKIGKIEEKRK